MKLTKSTYRNILSESAMDTIHGLLFEDKATDTVKTYIRNNCIQVLEPYLQTNVNELPENLKDTIRNVDTSLYDKCSEQNQNLMMFLRLHFLRYFDIGHGKGPTKFIIGLARIGIGELGFYTTTNNQSELSLLKQLVLFADSNEEVKQSLDANLNGLSFDELKKLLNEKRKEYNQQMRSKLGNTVTSNRKYKVVPINSAKEAEQYAKYFPDEKNEKWCITYGSFDSYAVGGSRFYFCLEDGFENVQREIGPGCPLDEYGLSMVSVLIDMDGEPTHITTRWNHAHDGENNEALHTAEQVQQVLGIPFYQTFKPYTREELHEMGIVLFDEVQDLLDSGKKPEEIFVYCGAFSEGFARVRLNNKWNLINRENELMFSQWFDWCGIFSEGFAKVQLNDKQNFINREGKIISPQWFDGCENFREGFAVVRLNDKLNFLNGEGNLLSSQWFDDCDDFIEGFAVVRLNDKLNFLNGKGKLLSSQWFDKCDKFHGGFAAVLLDDEWFKIDREGILYDDYGRPLSESKKNRKIIITESQAKSIVKNIMPAKKVNSAIMQAVSAGDGMGIAEEREPDYEIGFENNSPLDYAHVIGSAAPPITEGESQHKTLYHGVNRNKLEFNLEQNSFTPRVCSEGGPNAVWMSEEMYNYEFTFEITVPTKGLHRENNVDYTYDYVIPLNDAKLVRTKIYVHMDGMAVEVNLLDCELLKRQCAILGDKLCQTIYNDFQPYPHILNEIIKPALEKCVAITESKKVVNDEGETVPEKCDVCGSKVGLYIKGEPLYLCSKCGKYFGTMPFHKNKLNEDTELEEVTNPEDVDLSSFKTKQELNPKFWKDGKLDSRIRIQLLDIADQFMDTIDYDIDYEDVIVTGSIANYNWDERYSDVDLHIVVDYDKMGDDETLLRDYFDSKRKLWNDEHDGIKIYGFSVELYVQGKNDHHKAGGVYSLDKNEWLTEPISGQLNYDDIEEDEVKSKTSQYMNIIDELEEKLDACKSKYDAKNVYFDASKWIKRIRTERKTSLEGDSTEYATGNLVFKSLRRNGYIGKLMGIRKDAYDKYWSLP